MSNEKARERKRPGAKVPGSERATERIGQGAKVPGSELARVLLADSLRGANWPGSEKAVNPVPTYTIIGYTRGNPVYNPLWFTHTGDGYTQGWPCV